MQTQTKASEVPYDLLGTVQRHAEMLAHLLRGHDNTPSTWILSELAEAVAERTGKAFREVQKKHNEHYTAEEFGRYDTDYESLSWEFGRVVIILNAMAARSWYDSNDRGQWSDEALSIPDAAEYYHAACEFARTALEPFIGIHDKADAEGGDDA